MDKPKPDVPWTTYPVRAATKVEVGFPAMDIDERGMPWIPAGTYKWVRVLNPGWFDEGAGI